MRTVDVVAAADFARKTAEFASDFAGVARNLIMDVCDSYRPELHYMRGPGPKWSARYQPDTRLDHARLSPQHELSPVYAQRASRDRVGLD